jgi:transcriptional regulator with XRE-family HTH domain
MGTREDTAEHVRKRVHAERERQKITMAQLAQALSSRGIRTYATTIAKIEAGDRAVRIEELAAMAEIFGVGVDTLLGQQIPPEEQLARVMRGGVGIAHEVMRDIYLHQRRVAEFRQNLTLMAEEHASPALAQVADQAALVIHNMRACSAALIGLLALTIESESDDDT